MIAIFTYHPTAQGGERVQPPNLGGFTLIELLTVMAIIAILIGISLPLTSGLGTSLHIDSASDELAGRLNMTRQEAITENCLMEFRFYQSTVGATANQVIAYQPVQIGNDGVIQGVTKVNFIVPPLIYSSDTGLSSLFVPSQLASWTTVEPQPSLPSLQVSFSCYRFHFRPDGSTDLDPSKKWFVTIVDQHKAGSANQPPSNFATVWIDPISGYSKVVRPN